MTVTVPCPDLPFAERGRPARAADAAPGAVSDRGLKFRIPEIPPGVGKGFGDGAQSGDSAGRG